MSLVNVSPNELIKEAGELENTNAEFLNAVRQLEELEENLNGMWEGEANDTFHNAFNSDKIQMTNFYNAIQQYVNVLREIAGRYQQAEAVNTDTARVRKY